MWPFVSEKIIQCMRSVKNKYKQVADFCTDAITPTFDHTTEIVLLANINFIEF